MFKDVLSIPKTPQEPKHMNGGEKFIPVTKNVLIFCIFTYLYISIWLKNTVIIKKYLDTVWGGCFWVFFKAMSLFGFGISSFPVRYWCI